MENRINFTKEHKERMEELAVKFLFNNTYFKGVLNNNYTVNQLIHELTLDSLTDMKSKLSNYINKKEESADDWTSSDSDQRALSLAKDKKEFLNLLIGFKKFQTQMERLKAEKLEIVSKLNKLREDTKTPEERIKDLENQLSELDNF